MFKRKLKLPELYPWLYLWSRTPVGGCRASPRMHRKMKCSAKIRGEQIYRKVKALIWDLQYHRSCVHSREHYSELKNQPREQFFWIPESPQLSLLHLG